VNYKIISRLNKIEKPEIEAHHPFPRGRLSFVYHHFGYKKN